MASVFFRVSLISLLASTSAAHGEAVAKTTLVCEVEQTLLLADNPSDFPNGPAYFSLFPDASSKIKADSSLTNREIERMKAARSFIEKFRGASFTVDTTSGILSSIPFGEKRIKVIDQSGWNVSPRILSAESDPMNGYLFIGYFSGKSHDYYSFLTVDPQMNGVRIFRYSDLGGIDFGYCHST